MFAIFIKYFFKVNPQHFNKTFRDDLTLSSIGIGTYTGVPETTDDLKVKLLYYVCVFLIYPTFNIDVQCYC